MIILLYILSIVPITLFIMTLLLMDSFKLTSWKRLFGTAVSGAVCCLVMFGLGLLLNIEERGTVDAILSEVLKGSILLYLLKNRKIALLSDATIYGSTVGAGYATAECVLLLSHSLVLHHEIVVGEAIMIGLEAAVMHIGCTSLLAMMLIMAQQNKFGTKTWQKAFAYTIAFVAACAVHIIHNWATFIPPIILTSILVVYFVVSKRSLFKKNEKAIHDWIDDCINNEIALLGAIRKGELTTTNAGKYLLTLKECFDGETFFDMCCYISEYLELSITAKSNLLLKEAGLPIIKKPENAARIAELKALKKRIGYTGEHAIAPIVQIRAVDQWILKELI